MSTITKEFTKEQLIEQARKNIEVLRGAAERIPGASDAAVIHLKLAEIALASIEAEPVSVNDDMAYAFHHAISDSSLGSDEVEEIKAGLRAAFANVTAPPAPVSVPDEVLKRLLPDAEKAEFWFEHDGKILFEGVKFNNAVFEACRAAMLQGVDSNSPVIPDCWCRTCRPVVLNDMRFVVCPDCGNKRCPRANDHKNSCTGSNEPGQEGSAYPASPQEVKGE